VPAAFVSVLIVNYNGRRHLDSCLDALAAQDWPRHRFEVIVVDNASTDGSLEQLRAHHPWARTVALRQNLGFTGGNLAALEYARGNLIALLNNDTVARPGWLSESVRTMQRAPDIGGVAAKLLLHHEPGLLNSTGLFLLRDGRGSDRGFRAADHGQFERGDEVFGACGAAMLLRRDMLDDVGFFDPRYFMYYEDLDLAWRSRLRGWRFVYAPRAVVAHVHCATSGEASPLFCFHVERNRVLTGLKNAPPALALWGLAGLAMRILRAWWRVPAQRGRQRWSARHARACTAALVSCLTLLPRCLIDRYRIRVARRRVPDHALRPWIRRAA
jgi:GT2 family glycosyltransferase